MSYNEIIQRGTADFPVDFHHIDEHHTRYEMSAHWHTELEIIRILEGELKIRLNDRVCIARSGDILFINAETVHGAFPQGCVYECIVFDPDILCRDNDTLRASVEQVLNGGSLFKENIPENAAFHAAANSAFDILREHSAGYRFALLGALYTLFGIILNEQAPAVPEGHSRSMYKLKRVLTFLRENYDKPITLNDMAEAAGMSPKYFCYFFKEMTERTPVEYLNGYRIEKACRKLLNTDESVTEIAYSCGFNDLSYFIKTFKAHKNVTPAQFRK